MVDLLISMCKFIQLYKITKQLGTDWPFSVQEALSSIIGTRKNDKSFLDKCFFSSFRKQPVDISV